MTYQVTAMIRVKEGESGYRIVSESVKLGGSKLVSLDQLFEIFKKIAVGKQLVFEYIVSLKVVLVQDDLQYSQLPVEKKPPAK